MCVKNGWLDPDYIAYVSLQSLFSMQFHMRFTRAWRNPLTSLRARWEQTQHNVKIWRLLRMNTWQHRNKQNIKPDNVGKRAIGFNADFYRHRKKTWNVTFAKASVHYKPHLSRVSQWLHPNTEDMRSRWDHHELVYHASFKYVATNHEAYVINELKCAAGSRYLRWIRGFYFAFAYFKIQMYF